MSRDARVVLAGYLHHVMHLGHNHQVIFKEDRDHRKYIADIERLHQRFDVGIVGWCLLENAVHLLAVPYSNSGGKTLANFMQALDSGMTNHYNRKYHSTGTIWNGRFHSSPIQPWQWELASMRYLDTLAVHKGLVSNPAKYNWSSYRMRTGKVERNWLAMSQEYRDMAESENERQALYRLYCDQYIDEKECNLIEGAVYRGQLTGDTSFNDEVEKKYGIRVSNLAQGRPPSKKKGRFFNKPFRK